MAMNNLKVCPGAWKSYFGKCALTQPTHHTWWMPGEYHVWLISTGCPSLQDPRLNGPKRAPEMDGVVGPWDFSVSPRPLGFGFLGLGFRGFGPGLDNSADLPYEISWIRGWLFKDPIKTPHFQFWRPLRRGPRPSSTAPWNPRWPGRLGCTMRSVQRRVPLPWPSVRGRLHGCGESVKR